MGPVNFKEIISKKYSLMSLLLLTPEGRALVDTCSEREIIRDVSQAVLTLAMALDTLLHYSDPA